MAIIEVVKYNGSPDVLAWKYPNEELGTWTQLIVNESQEAILFKGGKALDSFTSGRHTLDTANIPVLNKIVNLPFGGRSPFTAEIWFINKMYSLDVKWGTTSPIQIQDPKYKVFIPIRSFGQFGIQIDDSRKFLIKLVGTLTKFDKDSIIKYFRGLYVTMVKDAISSYLIERQISVLEINAYLHEISIFLKDKLTPTMSEYGIKLLNFYVNDISIPEDDTAVKKLKDALARKAEMDIIGYSYAQERSFDTLEGAATNSGSGHAGFMGAGLGMGMGLGMGGTFGNQFDALTKNISTTTKKINCPKCNSLIDEESSFCSKCGYKKGSENKPDLISCSNCGKVMSKNVKFCPECGNIYNPCPECGADMKENDTACSNCGFKKGEPCPCCGIAIKSNSKFCPECGGSLQKKCTSCNAEIHGSPKFCPECGQKL